MKYVLISLAVLIVTFFIVLFFIPKDLVSDNRLIQMLVDLKNGRDFSNGRFALYGVAFALFLKNPIFGIGWGEFANYAILTGNTRVRNVHCVYLQLLCETGIVGLTVILSSILYNYISSIKTAIKKPNNYLIEFSILSQSFFIFISLIDNAILLQHFWLIYPITMLIIFKYSNSDEVSVGE